MNRKLVPQSRLPSTEAPRLWGYCRALRERQVRLTVYSADGRREIFQLGVHAPELSQRDLDLIHELWLDAHKTIGPQIHHRDIVTAALREFAEDLSSDRRADILSKLRDQIEP